MQSTTLRHLRWRGDDDPDRFDSAEVELGPRWLQARGESLTPAYRLEWSLTTTDGWVTEALDVSVDAGAWSRRLALRRGRDGAWSAEAESVGAAGLAAPGLLLDPAGLDGALDCDLGFCPATNTMPILRHGLQTADPAPRQELLMAFVEVPSLTVLPSRQGYTQETGPDGRRIATVRYESLDSQFRSSLTVDPDGLVIDYPQLAHRI